MAGAGKVVEAARLVLATVEVWHAARRTMFCARFPARSPGRPMSSMRIVVGSRGGA